jgi:hypothetical protein
MAVSASWSNTNNLQGNFGAMGRNVLHSGWVYASSPVNAGTLLISAPANNSLNDRRGLHPSIGGANPAYTTSEGSSAATISHTSAITASTWEHIAGFDQAASERRIFLNSALVNQLVNALTPAAPAWTRIGSRFDGTWNNSTWQYAEISTWDIAGFSVAQVEALASRLYTLVGGKIPNPLNVTADAGQPWTGKLLRYWPLTTNADLNDAMGSGDNFSVNGTVNTSGTAHPDVEAYSALANLVPDMEPLYYGATLLESKTGIQYTVRLGHTNLNGISVATGVNGTTNDLGEFSLPSPITNDEEPLSAADPVTVSLYWEEGSDPVVDRSIIVKTTLVADE